MDFSWSRRFCEKPVLILSLSKDHFFARRSAAAKKEAPEAT
jgi:hypothetical protein